MATDVSSRRLVRRTDDRIVAGVASGVAAYLGIDPVLVRVFFVLSVFVGGIGLIAYAAVWFLAPEGPADQPPPATRTDRNAGFWVAIALFLMGGLALADNIADRSLVWPILLIGAGVALWRSDASRRSADAASAPPSPTIATPSPAEQLRREIDEELERERAAGHRESVPPTPPGATTVPPPVVPPTPAVTPPAPARPSAARRWRQRRSERETSPLGGVTFAAMLLAVGGMLLLDQLNVIAIDGSDVVATALLVTGVGLLIGSVAGRARWLAAPAVFVLVPLLAITTITENLGLDLSAGIGEREIVVEDPGELEPRYQYGIGEYIIDLSDLEGIGAGQTLDTHASLAVGQMTIVVPDDMTVVVDYRVALGATDLFHENDNGGSDVKGQRTFEGEAGGGRLELEANVGIGELVLLRDDAAVRPLTRN